MNTLAEDQFTEFIIRKMKEREDIIVMKKKLEVQAVPEFADLFQNSMFRSRKFGFLTSQMRTENFIST